MKFRTKMILGVAAIEAVFLAVLVFYALSFLTESNVELFEEKMSSTVSLLEQSSIDALLTYDIARLDSLAQQVASAPDVVYVKMSIADTDVVSTGSALLGHESTTKDLYLKMVPVIFEGSSIGKIEIMFDGSDIEKVVANSGFYLGSIALIEILFVALASYLLGWTLTRDLDKISTASKEIEIKGPGHTVRHNNNDEIGQVIDYFNKMSKAMSAQYQDLERAKTEATEANKAKDDFLALISHEIRTPLNGILGMSKLMETELTGEQKQNCKVINDSGEHLMTILNEILDFSKIEQNKLDLCNNPFLIDKMSRLTFSFFNPLCVDKNIELVVDNQVPNDRVWVGDKARVKQIVFNLLSNAIKFTPKGNVTLRFRWQEALQPSALVIEVIDSGVGIPDDKVQTILQPFVQADNTITRDYGGTGLGLAIVNKLAEKMNGTLEINSRVGYGSQFTVTLPLESYLEQNKDVTNLEYHSKLEDIDWRAPNNSRILLVDDNKVNLIVGKKWCEKLGFEVDVANGHKQALELLTANDYLCLLVDNHMPKVSGVELIEQMQELKQNLVIFGWTADLSDITKQNFLRVGAKGVVFKPLDVQNFSEVVIDVLVEAEKAQLK